MKRCKACGEPAIVKLVLDVTYGQIVPTGEPLVFRLKGCYCAEHATLAVEADAIKVVRSHVLA